MWVINIQTCGSNARTVCTAGTARPMDTTPEEYHSHGKRDHMHGRARLVAHRLVAHVPGFCVVNEVLIRKTC